MAKDAMVQTIREARKNPVERDALYNVVREYGAPDDTNGVMASAITATTATGSN